MLANLYSIHHLWKSVPKSSVGDDTNVLLPIVLTTWVNNNDNGTVTLTFEYEVLESKKDVAKEVQLVMPASNATIESSDNDNVTLTYVEDGLSLKIAKLDEFTSGSFEVLVGDVDDEENLFPMELYFEASKVIEPSSKNAVVSVTSITANETGEELPFDMYYNTSNEGYYIV
ncbi:unnamed protein product [Ambrosiozyma monospora]|uniref:Unnamed protein product n=1 Tax=Ambrosiozyma monospora TaxID=43982 RepID=A0A9W6YRB9_AMBMO|nr:unnamed protein product [Ambrosiozyma monospora]